MVRFDTAPGWRVPASTRRLVLLASVVLLALGLSVLPSLMGRARQVVEHANGSESALEQLLKILEGTVAKAAYLGKQREYTISSPVGPLFCVDGGRAPARPVGAAVHVGLAEGGIVVLPG